MILLITMLIGCEEKQESFDEYCNQDPEANEIAVDADCDGILTEEDCDDSDPNTINDMDCDGVATADDCDDNEPYLKSIATDADCDGVLTELDCNDNDPFLLLKKTDTDCNGFQDSSILGSGSAYTCGIDPENKVECWGTQPGEIPNKTFTHVSTGFAHTCGLTTERTIECWGPEDGGNLDHGQVTDVPDGEFIQVSSGDFHSCAVSITGSIECWGKNDDGQSSPPEGGEFFQVTTGAHHSCGLRYQTAWGEGTVECWGGNAEGQLNAPERDIGSFLVAQISAGSTHTCGLGTDGSVECWGEDTTALYPPGPETTRFSQISSGSGFSCGVTQGGEDLGPDYASSGDVMCWGSDDYGESSFIPSKKFLQVAAGQNYISALTFDGKVYCWGLSLAEGNCEPPADFSAF